MLPAKITASATLSIIFLLPVCATDMSASYHTAWWTHFTYMFFHANVWHLASNIYSLCLFSPSPAKLFAACVIAAIASVFSSQPVLGFSGVVFALWGISMLKAGKKACILFTVSAVVSLLVPAFSASVHIGSFFLGWCYAFVEKLSYDYRRVKAGK